ncbi:putative PIG3 family NAD(P)H quinone oxidoreductase [Brevibacterium sanguinis]|uniref:PIG3 family NAD(P)H quinone oxidoreductase n=2 Tax=Brevibacterium TaxID=1696 RepID=A0ABX9GL83_9MICO|nr:MULTISPECIES: NAD(P)H-quinone oxidoreductase [Brevibacterium]RBP62507.1 putative PIG3 family NAD(P)H quinone oxidoreductase [Brevibacterium sanguinis]RBP69171.1 putative PIG3 family NAD(P)H quinone oxidoreductase [Brevibacterium celere]
MRAITFSAPGGPEVLEVTDEPQPGTAPDEVLVAVHAAGINRADLLQRQGFYDPPPGATRIPGLEVSGTIAEVGPEVTGWKVGDRVAALLTGGGYAEAVPVPAGQLLPVPDSLDLTEAAALPEVLATVHSNIVGRAGIRAGEWLLVHGGASGIGTAAIQIARHLGVRVVVTVGSERKAQFCRDLGADAVINYRDEDFVARVHEICTREDGSSGADVILDIIGAKYLKRNIDALATDGRLVIIGLQGGTKTEINLGDLLQPRKTVTATTLRARPKEQKARIVAEVAQQLWPAVASGDIRPIVHDTLPLAEAGRGHAALEEGASIGKMLLIVDESSADRTAQPSDVSQEEGTRP